MATTTDEIPPAPIEWANFTYRGIDCGVAKDVTLVNGEDSTLAPDQFATLVGVSTLTDGNVVVDFSCLVGPTGRGGTESLLLYTAEGQLLDRFDLGVYASATLSADGTGIIEFSELADSDPMCCPSILKQSTLSIENRRFIVSEPTLVQP